VAVRKTRVRKDADRHCPKCGDGLVERPLKKSGIRVDGCPTCHGMWFDRHELEGHLGGPDDAFMPSADSSVSSRPCPACGVAMTCFVVRGSGVTIDMCEHCKGVWLDVGELQRLEECALPPAGILASLRRMLGL